MAYVSDYSPWKYLYWWLWTVTSPNICSSKCLLAVPYPELFWNQYTGLGSQTQTPKRSKVLISSVSFHQRSLSQSQESDVSSYSEHKIAKNSQGFAPGPHWGGLTAPPQTPRLHNGFSPRYARQKTDTPKKLLHTALVGCYLNLPTIVQMNVQM